MKNFRKLLKENEIFHPRQPHKLKALVDELNAHVKLYEELHVKLSKLEEECNADTHAFALIDELDKILPKKHPEVEDIDLHDSEYSFSVEQLEGHFDLLIYFNSEKGYETIKNDAKAHEVANKVLAEIDQFVGDKNMVTLEDIYHADNEEDGVKIREYSALYRFNIIEWES